MKKIIINGNNFSNLEEFYEEIEKILTKDLTWKPGHNLSAFNDLLKGGFGVHEYGEKLHIKWINFSKSKETLDPIETKKYYQHILNNCHPTSKKNIEKKLEFLEEGLGETLIDIILSIILDNCEDLEIIK